MEDIVPVNVITKADGNPFDNTGQILAMPTQERSFANIYLVQDGSEIVRYFFKNGLTNNHLAVWSTSGGDTVTATVEVSSAEILQLNSSPKTIVAAQGAGTVILPIRAIFKIYAGDTAYDTNITPFLSLGNLSMGTASSLLNAGFDSYSFVNYAPAVTQQVDNTVENVPLVLKCAGNPENGNGTMVVVVVYQVITI